MLGGEVKDLSGLDTNTTVLHLGALEPTSRKIFRTKIFQIKNQTIKQLLRCCNAYGCGAFG